MRTKFDIKTEVIFRTIYAALEKGLAVIGPTQVAEELGISKSTAHKMLSELSEAGYGVYVPKKGLVVNEKGEMKAREAVRVHRLIECMLAELGVEDFCNEAEKIGMVAGKSFVEALEARYGDRKFCPCGKRIPEVER